MGEIAKATAESQGTHGRGCSSSVLDPTPSFLECLESVGYIPQVVAPYVSPYAHVHCRAYRDLPPTGPQTALQTLNPLIQNQWILPLPPLIPILKELHVFVFCFFSLSNEPLLRREWCVEPLVPDIFPKEVIK